MENAAPANQDFGLFFVFPLQAYLHYRIAVESTGAFTQYLILNIIAVHMLFVHKVSTKKYTRFEI